MSTFTDSENETTVTLERESSLPLEDMPFLLLVLGEWGGQNDNSALGERLPIEIDRDNFDEVLRKLNVEIDLDLNGEGSVRIRFEEMEDFHPDRIYNQVALFADLRETRRQLQSPHTFQQAAAKLRTNSAEENPENSKDTVNQLAASDESAADSGGLLNQILSQSSDNSFQKQSSSHPKSGLDDLIRRLVRPHLVEINETEQTKHLEAVDEATGQLMRTILHHPHFKKLESAWRAAYLLVTRIETDSNLKIYLFETSKAELEADLKAVNNLSDSNFHKILNDKTFGSFGESAWAVVCGNYTFEPNVEDTALLMRIAKIAQASETVFIAQASPKILGVNSLTEILEFDDWHLPENSAERKLWEMLRGLDESASVGLSIPRFLGRMPYGAQSDPTENFSFEEITDPNENGDYLWINSAFACILLMAQSFSAAEWDFSRNLIRDINDLPLYLYRDGSQTVVKPITEAVISVKAAEKMIDSGLMPLVSFRDDDRIRLARFQSIASPPRPLSGKWDS